MTSFNLYTLANDKNQTPAASLKDKLLRSDINASVLDYIGLSEDEINEKSKNIQISINPNIYFSDGRTIPGSKHILITDGVDVIKIALKKDFVGPESIVHLHYGVPHNTKGPTYINFDIRGKTTLRSWFFNERYHNNSGPAIIKYYNGRAYYYAYYINGKRHNPIGPAKVEYGIASGCLLYRKFYINNQEVSLDCFTKKLSKRIYNEREVETLDR